MDELLLCKLAREGEEIEGVALFGVWSSPATQQVGSRNGAAALGREEVVHPQPNLLLRNFRCRLWGGSRMGEKLSPLSDSRRFHAGRQSWKKGMPAVVIGENLANF